MTSSADQPALCVVRSSRGTATGFAFLRPEWVATAGHAVGDPPEPVRLEFAGSPACAARVLLRHPRFDLAVVALASPGPFAVPFQPAQDVPDPGPLLCVHANPLRRDALAEALVSRVEAFERTRRQRDGGAETLFIFPAPPGEPVRSGSPLVTLDGRVVAIVTDGIRLGGVDCLRAPAIEPLLAPLAALARAGSP